MSSNVTFLTADRILRGVRRDTPFPSICSIHPCPRTLNGDAVQLIMEARGHVMQSLQEVINTRIAVRRHGLQVDDLTL